MKLRELMERLDEIAAEDPSTLDLEIIQQSCFDEPLAFESNNVYVISEHYAVEDAILLDPEEAENRADEDGDEVEIRGRAIVIESF